MWKKFLLVVGVLLLQLPAMADAGVRVGIGLGFGFPIGPYPYYGYGYPYPYYAPYAYPPVVVQQPGVVMPAPAYYQQAPTAPMAMPATPMAAPATTTNAPPAYNPSPSFVAGSSPVYTPAPPAAPQGSGVVLSSYDRSAADAALQKLSQADENVRRDAVMDLGKMKADIAVDSIISIMNNDGSPVVRDAAARALGLIGSSRCLPALIRAAQVDNDRDVRRSAQFAIEVIRSQIRR